MDNPKWAVGGGKYKPIRLGEGSITRGWGRGVGGWVRDREVGWWV